MGPETMRREAVVDETSCFTGDDVANLAYNGVTAEGVEILDVLGAVLLGGAGVGFPCFPSVFVFLRRKPAIAWYENWP
jgi:hypothetical protein